jgi:hypothetical protein
MQDVITREFIASLVTDRVRESRTLEYKRDWVGASDVEKKEFLADAVAFANAVGGMMLFGIDEERDADNKPTGIARQALGIQTQNADAEIRRVTDIIRNGIEPALPNVTILPVDGFPQGPVISIHIPRSHRAPHMVSFKASPRFFSRVSNGRHPLDMDELRDAFLRAEDLPARIRDFRNRRIQAIDGGEAPVPMEPGPLVVLHVVPVDTFGDHNAIPFADVVAAGRNIRLVRFSRWDYAINLDGHLTWVPTKGDGPKQALGYLQAFRDGAIEVVDGLAVAPASDTGGSLSPAILEATLVEQVMEYSRHSASLPIGNELAIMVTLVNMKGFRAEPSDRHDQRFLDRRIAAIPEVVIDSHKASTPASLKPVLDMLWQACGFSGSPSFPHLPESTEWINPCRGT